LQNVICVRLLSPDEYGTLAVITTIVLSFQNIVGMRTGELVLKYISCKDDRTKIYPTLLKIIYIDVKLSILVFFLILVFGFFVGNFLNVSIRLLFLLSLSVLFSMGLPVFESIFIVHDNLIKQYRIKFSCVFIGMFIVCITTYAAGFYGYILAVLFAAFLKNIIYYIFFRKELINNNIPLVADSKIKKLDGFWRFSKHSFLSTTFKSGIGGIDIILLSIVCSPANIALYKVSKSLAAIPGTFLGAVWNSIQPKILSYSKNNMAKDLFLLTNKYTLRFLLCFAFVFIFLLFFSEHILTILYGVEYADASLPFLILFSGFWLGYTFGPYGRTYFLAKNRMHMMTLLNGVTFFIILIFGYIYRDSIIKMSAIVISGMLITSFYVYSVTLRDYFNKRHH
jgi:O-antigen/teichoic acid export membrane protein